MDPNAISIAARTLRARLATALPLAETNIFIGNPTLAAGESKDKTGIQFLNLFFFQLEHSGHPADATSLDPVYLRAHCMVTAFGNKDSGNNNPTSAGENDLRLIGGVLAALHQQPVLEINGPGGAVKAMLQIIPQSLSLETIHNLWSTQGDVSFRPSVIYELALVPVPFAERRGRSPRVRRADADVYLLPEAGEWVPVLRFEDGSGRPVSALDFPPASAPATVSVHVAGKAGETVTLAWETWHPTQGWQRDPAFQTDVVITAATLDESLRESKEHQIGLPGPAMPNAEGQSLLVASRTFERSPGRPITLSSNPLLVSFFEPPPP